MRGVFALISFYCFTISRKPLLIELVVIILLTTSAVKHFNDIVSVLILIDSCHGKR